MSQVDATALLAIIALSASPVGEVLVAIPAGVALGVEPALVFAVAYTANLLPTVVLLIAAGSLQRKFPRVFRYFAREDGRLKRYLEGRYGSLTVLLVTPLIGVYATSISGAILGLDKKRSFILQAAGLMIYGAVETAGLYFGLRILTR